MAKSIATALGVAFLLVGVVGFFVPHLGGFHLGPAHSIVHLISGAAALYVGLKGTLTAARWFCLIFGSVYFLLGLVGFVAGAPGDRMLALIPGVLELGQRDHILHVLLGTVFLVGGLMTPVPRTVQPLH